MAWCCQATEPLSNTLLTEIYLTRPLLNFTCSSSLEGIWRKQIAHINLVRRGFNSFGSRQNGPHFPDNVFKCIFLNENVWIWIEISLKFVPKGPIDNIPKLIQLMAWHWPGNNPLSEATMVIWRIYVIWPQWIKFWSQSLPVMHKRIHPKLAKFGCQSGLLKYYVTVCTCSIALYRFFCL